MIDPELKQVVARLARAGTAFDCVCVARATGKPLKAAELNHLLTLDTDEWDAVWVPNFTFLGSDHPDAEFVAEQMAKFYGDPAYAARLADTAAEIDLTAQEEAISRDYRDSDWGVP